MSAKEAFLEAAEMAEETSEQFTAYERMWKERVNDARFRGCSEEEMENVGRMLTWRDSAGVAKNLAARLRAKDAGFHD